MFWASNSLLGTLHMRIKTSPYRRRQPLLRREILAARLVLSRLGFRLQTLTWFRVIRS